jgi:hypothetical protein
MTGDPVAPITDEELAALALAADPDEPVADDAVCLRPLTPVGTDGLLPEWYMPSPALGHPRMRGWRRVITLVIVVSFITINAFGLCSTYGAIG